MRIKSVAVEGFKSFKHKQLLDFESLNGLVLVTGKNEQNEKLSSNGAGKSTLFSDAILWVLFGKTASNIKGSNVRNWDNNIPCRVKLSIDDYVIERTHGPNTLKLNGNNVTQEELERKLNINFESFKSSTIITQFGEKFIDMTPMQRYDILIDTFSSILLRWDNLSDLAKEKYNSLKKKIDSKIVELQVLNKELNTLKNGIVELEENNAKWNDEIESKKIEIENIKKAISKCKLIEIEDSKELENIYYNIRENISKTKSELSILNREIDNVKILGPVCDKCGQKISNQYKQSVIDKNEKKIKELTSNLNELVNESKIIEDELNSIKEKEKLNIENKIKLERYNERISRLLTEINKENPFIALINKNKKKILEIEDNIRVISNEIEAMNKECNAVQFWIDGFRNIGMIVMTDVLNRLEILSNINIKLLGMKSWKIKVSIHAEGKSRKGIYISVSDSDKEMPYECWSGGEQQRIRMAISLAFAELVRIKNGIFGDILVLDEPTQHLSEEGIQELLYLLKEKSKQQKIFYIDHRDVRNLGIFDNIVTIVKNSEGSKIEKV